MTDPDAFPSLGDPGLAGRVVTCLEAAGLPRRKGEDRAGFSADAAPDGVRLEWWPRPELLAVASTEERHRLESEAPSPGRRVRSVMRVALAQILSGAGFVVVELDDADIGTLGHALRVLSGPARGWPPVR
ncbi:hypothetical protein ACQEU5_20820 [Marinactinospora thermotolerans]|uniref:Uncharacterized protein n=1 Tax=Marinactinospora thermotolerans DSM 45154 TaxID=1122192 RepID=A0A1T4PP52_9ACTN|nr:hypothetical protein [Marinactinospora thermotolerans]SJZ92987.1 hypothetical protein SAMN02745673_01903 [Marinactinospora thermotolerans DSM 45154]